MGIHKQCAQIADDFTSNPPKDSIDYNLGRYSVASMVRDKNYTRLQKIAIILLDI